MTTPVRIPWRQVPMPDRIARLPRDKRGFPVPWVSCWSPSKAGIEERTIDLGGGMSTTVPVGTCDHVAGVGVPDLANLCSHNQVIGMTERRCDVCGDEIDGTLYFVGAMNNTTFREPPLHLECAVYSLQVCPGISVAPGVGVVVCESYTMEPEILRRRLPHEPEEDLEGVIRHHYEGFLEAVLHLQTIRSPGVVMGVHVRPQNPERISREDFLATHVRPQA